MLSNTPGVAGGAEARVKNGDRANSSLQVWILNATLRLECGMCLFCSLVMYCFPINTICSLTVVIYRNYPEILLKISLKPKISKVTTRNC